MGAKQDFSSTFMVQSKTLVQNLAMECKARILFTHFVIQPKHFCCKARLLFDILDAKQDINLFKHFGSGCKYFVQNLWVQKETFVQPL